MIELRNRRLAHLRSGLAVTACVAVALLFASCRDAAQFLIAVHALRPVQQQVARVAGTNDVSVNLQNGSVLTVVLENVAGSGQSEVQRPELFREIATAAYLAFPSRSQLEAVAVARVARQRRYRFITYTVVTESQRFRPFQLIETSGLTERLVRPPDTSNRVYLVGVGTVQRDLVKQLAAHFRQTLGIDIEELPAISFDRVTVDNDRSQVVAEELIDAIRRRYPAVARDVNARTIGVTGDDMYLRTMAGSWAFGFSWRSDDGQTAVVSYKRMDPAVLGLPRDPDMLRSRVTKMV